MSVPSVSVLVPVYNGAPFLSECIESILNQDFTDFEVLVGDDGSSDGSVRLIEGYAARDQRVRWWQNSRNLGLGGNFNLCLSSAKGEYIKYVLQDDKLIGASVLGRMVEILQKDASVSLVASGSQIIDEHSRPRRLRFCYRQSGTWDGKDVIVRCLEENENRIGEPSLVMFRKSQAVRGFDVEYKQLLDLEMWFYLLEQGRFAYLAEPLCAFRQHPSQQTEVNWRTRTGRADGLLLADRYLAKPWMRQAATPQMLFSQLYYSRKHYGPEAAPLEAEIRKQLRPGRYTLCWLRHRFTKPFRNLSHWLEKRELRVKGA